MFTDHKLSGWIVRRWVVPSPDEAKWGWFKARRQAKLPPIRVADGAKGGAMVEPWTMQSLNHVPRAHYGKPHPSEVWGTEKSDLWVEWEKEKRMLAFDIKEGVKTTILLAFNSIVPWKLKIRHVFQLLTPADLSIPSQLEIRSLEHCKYLRVL